MPEAVPKPCPEVAVVLLGRGGVAASSADQLKSLAAELHAALADQGRAPLCVQAAFVDRWQPALPQALDACAAARTVVIVSVMLPDEPALRRWLGKLMMRWRAGQPSAPKLIFAEPLAQAPELREVLGAVLERSLSWPELAAQMKQGSWERDPAAWSSVPAHEHHVLWCTGPRCAAKGAMQLWPQLTKTVREVPGLKKRVMPLQTSCQYPCNHGPLMIVYPEGVWHGPLAEKDIEPVLTRHVLGGAVDPKLRIHGPTRLAPPQEGV